MAGKPDIVMRLEPDDDYMHPVESATNFNESMYFNVFDRENRIGGWFRIANRPNEGRGEMSCCIYLPDGRVGFMFKRAGRQRRLRRRRHEGHGGGAAQAPRRAL